MTTSTVSGNKDRTTNTVSVFQNRMGQIYTVRMYSTYSIRLHYPFLRKNLKSLIKRQNMQIIRSEQSCEKANGLMDMFVVVLNDVIKLCITDVFDSAVTRRFPVKTKNPQIEMKGSSNTCEGYTFNQTIMSDSTD